MNVAIKCECGAHLLNPFGVRDAMLIEKVSGGIERKPDLLDERTTARMIYLMYRGLRPDHDAPLMWRRTGTQPALDLGQIQ